MGGTCPCPGAQVSPQQGSVQSPGPGPTAGAEVSLLQALSGCAGRLCFPRRAVMWRRSGGSHTEWQHAIAGGARPASGKHLFYGCSYWAVWTAQAGWGLPDGVVSSPSSTGTPTKTRPPPRDWEGPVTPCLDQSSCAQPGQGWQPWKGCCSQESRRLSRCPPECLVFNQKQSDSPMSHRPNSPQSGRAPA